MRPRLLGAILATFASIWMGQGKTAQAIDAPNAAGVVQLGASEEREMDSSGQTPRNRLQFLGGDAAQRHWEALQQQLQDPAQRKRMWNERRARIAQSHPELGESLGIDAATEQKLLDLLTDHELEQLSLGFGFDSTLERADFETRRLEALRELLGEEGQQRYRQYVETLHERQQVARLNDSLAPADKLTRDQKDQLMALFAEHWRRRLELDLQARDGRLLAPLLQPSTDPSQSLALREIEANEIELHRRMESNRALQEQAREILSDAQQAALVRMHREEEQGMRRWIEERRVQAGLPPEIPEHERPEPSSPTRTPVLADLALEFTVTVNRSPPKTTQINVANGEPVMIEGGEGLWIEATPTLYDDDWLVVAMNYFEEDAGGEKRLIHKGGSFASRTRLADGSRGGGVGGSGGMVVGSKGYAVEVFVKML